MVVEVWEGGKRGDLSAGARAALERVEAGMRGRRLGQAGEGELYRGHNRQPSDASLFTRLTIMLPGFSRLPVDCPLPIESMRVDDTYRTELASTLRPGLGSSENGAERGRRGERDESGETDEERANQVYSSDLGRGRGLYSDPLRANRGLCYPREMLVPAATIWVGVRGSGGSEESEGSREEVERVVGEIERAGIEVVRDPEGKGGVRGSWCAVKQTRRRKYVSG